jgi:tyrosine-protein phosphatase SIW14
MKPWLLWGLGLAVAALVLAPPIVRYRVLYTHHKRLREVAAGRFYRSGQLTAEGLRDAANELKIRTVINVQDEYPDPKMARSFWDRTMVGEKSVCDQLGIRYIHLAPIPHPEINNFEAQPAVIAEFLKILDDPSVYPVLLHCRAGLHRTGVLTAVYRMEFDGWTHAAAFDELKGHGFGDADCTCANDYVRQFVLNYKPRRAERLTSE